MLAEVKRPNLRKKLSSQTTAQRAEGIPSLLWRWHGCAYHWKLEQLGAERRGKRQRSLRLPRTRASSGQYSTAGLVPLQRKQ